MTFADVYFVEKTHRSHNHGTNKAHERERKNIHYAGTAGEQHAAGRTCGEISPSSEPYLQLEKDIIRERRNDIRGQKRTHQCKGGRETLSLRTKTERQRQLDQ